MVLPGKSGITLDGITLGCEAPTPASLTPKEMTEFSSRQVRYTDIDRNGHMNNTRYMEWFWDLLDSDFHRTHPLKAFTACYLSEAKEGQPIQLDWQLFDGPVLQVDAHREKTGVSDKNERVFSAQVLFE